MDNIGHYAFQNCDSLEHIYISKNVTNIGENAFADCQDLTVFGYRDSFVENYCNENNKNFIAIDDVSSISIYKNPEKKQFINKSVDLSGLILLVKLNDGTSFYIENGYSVDVDYYTNIGENILKISLNEI